MQNKTTKLIISLLLVACHCLCAEGSPLQIHAELDKLSRSVEFFGPEMDRLKALPPETVEILTRRLDSLQVNEPQESRFSGFLLVKLEQFFLELPPETVQVAIRALERKAHDPKVTFGEARRKEMAPVIERIRSGLSSKASPPSAPEVKPVLRNDNSGVDVTPAGKPSQLANEAPSAEAPAVTWLTRTAIIIVALGLLGWLLKKRK